MLAKRSEDRRITTARNAVRGGVVGFEAGLVVVAAAEYLAYDAALFILAPLIAGLVVAGLITLIGLLVQRRNRSLAVVQDELEKGLAMLERGMIDEADYRHIKQHALESYRPGRADSRAVVRWAVRGGVAAATLPLLLMAADAISWGIGGFGILLILATTVVGSGLSAGGTAAVLALQSGDREEPPHLPVAEYRMLGEDSAPPLG